MEEKEAKKLLIKSGLSEKKATEISSHLAREFNKEVKEKDVNEVVIKKPKIKVRDVNEVLIGGDK